VRYEIPGVASPCTESVLPMDRVPIRNVEHAPRRNALTSVATQGHNEYAPVPFRLPRKRDLRARHRVGSESREVNGNLAFLTRPQEGPHRMKHARLSGCTAQFTAVLAAPRARVEARSRDVKLASRGGEGHGAFMARAVRDALVRS
jgi:hypothetical protein